MSDSSKPATPGTTSARGEELREIIAEWIARWDHDSENGDWPLDAVRASLAELTEPHLGDCNGAPCPCLRCHADSVYRRADDLLAALATRSDEANAASVGMPADIDERHRYLIKRNADGAFIASTDDLGTSLPEGHILVDTIGVDGLGPGIRRYLKDRLATLQPSSVADDRMREALKPFACESGVNIDNIDSDDEEVAIWVTVAQIKAARAALEKDGGAA